MIRKYLSILNLVMIIVLIILPISAVNSYVITSTLLNVNIDGSVEVNQIIQDINLNTNITIPLLGNPIYIEALSNNIPQPLEIKGNSVLIVPISSELKIRYITNDLTNKTGEEWIISYNSPWNTGVILPEEAIVLEVNPETFDVDIINNTAVLIFPPGTVTIKYLIIPDTAISPPPGNLSPNIGGDIYIYILLALLVVGSAIILIKFLSSKRKIKIEKHILDERDSQIIKVLEDHGELTAKEIMEKTGIPKTPLYRRLKRLVKQGYLEQKTLSGVTYFYVRKKGK